ncbi:MAG: OmpH family outer membrane protein [Verrucomicrobia bacterium]|nr:OmpH family outer membrane protein [Verrucomicrobiota bacterium]
MKSKLLALCLSLACFAAPATDLKIGTLDVQRVIADYHKAQTVTRQLKEQEVSFVKELDGLRFEGNRLLAEAEGVRKLSLDVALSETVREGKEKEFEMKLMDVRALEARLLETKSKRESDLQARFAQATKIIHEDIDAVTRSLGEKEGFNLILNRNQANPVAGEVLFAKNIEDVTAKVLALLNASASPLSDAAVTAPKEQTK